MKKTFIFVVLTLAAVVIIFCAGHIFRPVVEEYGVTTVQYDEKTGTYFAEVTSRYELEPIAEMKAGVPVSYYKTDGTVLRVCSTLESKQEIQARSVRNMWLGFGIGGGIVWFLFLIVLLREYQRQKRIDALRMEFDKAESVYNAKKARED